MEFAKTKSRALRFSIIIRDNKTSKTKSIRFDNDVKDVGELLDLIKELLEKHYDKYDEKEIY